MCRGDCICSRLPAGFKQTFSPNQKRPMVEFHQSSGKSSGRAGRSRLAEAGSPLASLEGWRENGGGCCPLSTGESIWAPFIIFSLWVL
jgi:hypothetical protein